MKKVLFTAIAVLGFTFANAQEGTTSTGGTKFGAKAGLNMSNLTGDAETDSKVGFFVGGFAEIKLSDKFAVQPELLYSMLGAKDDDANWDMNYLLIPVMAKYFVTEQLSLEAGPQIGFLMSAKYDGVDVKDFFSSTDLAFNLGAGYDVTEAINVSLRYSLGMSNVLDSDTFGDADAKTSNIGLAVGYKF